MHAFYISGDKLVITSASTRGSVDASYYEVVESHGSYVVLVTYFNTDGFMSGTSTLYSSGSYDGVMGYLIDKYESI